MSTMSVLHSLVWPDEKRHTGLLLLYVDMTHNILNTDGLPEVTVKKWTHLYLLDNKHYIIA